jgi:hypothetical protein
VPRGSSLPARQNHLAAPPNHLPACRDAHHHGTTHHHHHPPSPIWKPPSTHPRHTPRCLLINRLAPAHPYRWALAFIERRIPIANHHCHQHFRFATLGAHEKIRSGFPVIKRPRTNIHCVGPDQINKWTNHCRAPTGDFEEGQSRLRRHICSDNSLAATSFNQVHYKNSHPRNGGQRTKSFYFVSSTHTLSLFRLIRYQRLSEPLPLPSPRSSGVTRPCLSIHLSEHRIHRGTASVKESPATKATTRSSNGRKSVTQNHRLVVRLCTLISSLGKFLCWLPQQKGTHARLIHGRHLCSCNNTPSLLRLTTVSLALHNNCNNCRNLLNHRRSLSRYRYQSGRHTSLGRSPGPQFANWSTID